jgi:hypothetical protein
MSIIFASAELTTLFGTWWGLIGFWQGPVYILRNLVEYISATFRFVGKQEHIRKGLQRLCVAAGITWIGWVGYRSFDAVAGSYSWSDLSIIVWLLVFPIGGPILIAWVIAAFQKQGGCE